jgi:hypothetical protein
VVLVVGLVVAYGAALTSLGLALATWVPRLGRAVGLCVAAHVGVTVGWVVLVAILTPRAPGLTGPGLASFSPFLGVMLPTLEVQMAKAVKSHWDEAVGWVAFWTVADAALAAPPAEPRGQAAGVAAGAAGRRNPCGSTQRDDRGRDSRRRRAAAQPDCIEYMKSRKVQVRWNPAGNQSRPAELGQRPEASLARCSSNRHCEA